MSLRVYESYQKKLNMIAVNSALHFGGWALLPSVVPADLVHRMRDDLNVARQVCRMMQVANGVDDDTHSTVHHLPALPELKAFLEFLEHNPAHDVLNEYFDGKPYILNSMGGNFNEANNYASNIHRDIRSFHDRCPMLNTLVMLDDFTPENGATWLMTGGHFYEEKPSEAEFMSRAIQVSAPVGSILVWNSCLWHRAGENMTGKPRRIVTPIFTTPWYKQGMDYPRAIGYDAELSPTLRQVLGYNARVPATFDEWYRKPEERMYRPDQG